MSEKMRSNPRLENFDANKAAFEKSQFEEALYGDAGTEDFSDKAHTRVQEADAYERHMETLAERPNHDPASAEGARARRTDFINTMDDLNSQESAGYNKEWDDAIAENEAFDAAKVAEDEALAEKFAGDVNLRRMDRMSEEIHRLRSQGTDERRLHELEDRLQDLLIAYSSSEDYDERIADMLMDRDDKKAHATAAKSALKGRAEKPEAMIKEPKDGELIDEKEPEHSKSDLKSPKDGELVDTEPTDIDSAGETPVSVGRTRRMGAALIDLLRRRRRETTEAKADDEKIAADETAEVEEDAHEKEPIKLTIGSREAKSTYHDVTEDYLLSDTENKIFGVFDGMGGQGGSPDAASRAAAEAAHRSLIDGGEPTTTEELGRSVFAAFTAARENVTKNGEGGSTVATLIRLAEIDGENYMAVAHAGDTRLFGYRTRIRELTTDQSDGNVVDNGLISGDRGNSLDEYKLYKIPKGLRLMLCSDGITGDWAHQFLSDEEMLEAFTQPTPDAAAQRFIELSKKDDDKTVIVIDVE